ncbi:hypothetical protein ACFPOB_20515 [Bosea eneae]|uniref:Uncharacterized protein n=1 Tax=Bosea eneae TaxID=151454 RepID=A0ABW0IUM5_9HYPH
MDAFWALTGDRQLGALGGAGRIPFSAIDRWADRYGISDLDAFERLKTLIDVLDAEFLKLAAKPDP